ncbi:MAG: response regulator transcription factor [Nitrospinae bacterium]|nr:response regulator transcription factor [Nitrospinota bacterium]
MSWKKGLSDREVEVSNLVAEGFTNDQIAQKLGISHATVKTHLRNVYSKVNVKDRTNLTIKVLNKK